MYPMLQAPSFEKIVVTGGIGFIGQHLLDALVKGGYCPTAITRRLEQINDVPAPLRERVRWIELDLLDQESVSRFIEAEKPSVLFHLAGTRGTGNESGNVASICQKLNVDATVHLLKAANDVGAERIVIAGSAEEYGNQSAPFDETSPLDPVSVYGQSKAEASRLALELHERENCPVVIVRLFTVYGPAQPRGMFVSDAVAAAVNSESFPMSEGTQERDLVYVDDVVTALIAAGRKQGIEGRVFNLGSGRPVRLRDVAEMIWRISETGAALLIGTRVRADDDMQVTWAKISLALEYLGWEPHVSLEDGLRRTIHWAKENLGVR